MIEATLKEMEILRFLYDEDDLNAAAIARKGAVPRGTIYSLLQRLEKKGYLESWRVEQEPNAPGGPKRYYSLLRHGRKAFRIQLRRLIPDSLPPKPVLQD